MLGQGSQWCQRTPALLICCPPPSLPSLPPHSLIPSVTFYPLSFHYLTSNPQSSPLFSSHADLLKRIQNKQRSIFRVNAIILSSQSLHNSPSSAPLPFWLPLSLWPPLTVPLIFCHSQSFSRLANLWCERINLELSIRRNIKSFLSAQLGQ